MARAPPAQPNSKLSELKDLCGNLPGYLHMPLGNPASHKLPIEVCGDPP